MPLPSDLRTAFEGGLFLLTLLAALYATREIVLPVVLALVLRLVLQPAVRLLERLRLPGVLSALLLISLLLGAVVTLGTALYGPAASWAAKLPEGIPRLQEHLRFLRAPIEAVHNFLRLAEGYVTGQPPPVLATAGPELRVIVTDVHLAGEMTGVQLAEFATQTYPRLKVIVMSGRETASLPLGTCFLRKPCQPHELLEAVFC